MNQSLQIHRRKTLSTAIMLSTCLAAAPTCGFAQNDDLAIEEIIVTATKREQSLQEIPLSVRAIGQDELEKIGALSFEDYAQGQAGLSFTSSGRFARGGTVPTLRGVAQLNPQGPTAAFYLDETPLQPQETERVGIPDPNMFDTNRVEILRGPQGDLFGSSAMGGTIRVIPNKPNSEAFEGRLNFSAGSVDSGGTDSQVNGMVNIPLSDTAALRLVATYADDAGYIDLMPEPSLGTPAVSDANDVQSTMIRAILRWEVNDQFTVTPSLFWQDVEEDRARFVSDSLSSASGDYVDINYGVDEFSNNEFVVGNLLMEYDLGWALLTSSTTVYDLDWDNQLGSTGIVNLVVGGLDPSTLDDVGSEEQFVQELRLTSSLDGPFNYIVGLFYRDIEHEFAQLSIADSFLPVFGTDILFSKEGEVEKLDELAFFGQGTYAFNEEWELAVGARYYDYERDRLTPTAGGVFGFPERVDNIDDSGVSPTATLRYTPSQDAMIYGRAANGFRPGFGFTTIFPPPCASELERLGIDADSGVGTVDADEVWNYEIGAKTSWLDNRLVVNAAWYHIDWTDVQSAVGLDCGFILSANAGEAIVDGVEVETQLQASENVNLALNVGYTDAQLDEDAPGIGGFKGDTLPGVPQWTVGAAAEFYFPIVGNPSYLRVDYRYTSEYFYGFSNDDTSSRNRKPSLGQLGLRLGMEYDDWEFSVFVRNLTDEFELGMCGPDNVFRLPGRPDFSTCGVKPRTIGLSIGKYFR